MGFFLKSRSFCPAVFRRLLVDNEKPLWYGMSRQYSKKAALSVMLIVLIASLLLSDFLRDSAFFDLRDMVIVIFIWLFVMFVVGTFIVFFTLGANTTCSYLLTDKRLIIREKGKINEILLENIDAVTLCSKNAAHISLSFNRDENGVTTCEHGRNRLAYEPYFGKILKVRYGENISVLDISRPQRLISVFERLVCGDDDLKECIPPLIFSWKYYLHEGEKIIRKDRSVGAWYSHMHIIVPVGMYALISIDPVRLYREGVYTQNELLHMLSTLAFFALIMHILLKPLIRSGAPVERYALTDRRILIYGKDKKMRSVRLDDITYVRTDKHKSFSQVWDEDKLEADERSQQDEVLFDMPDLEENKAYTHMNGYVLRIRHKDGAWELAVRRPEKLRIMIENVRNSINI